MSVVDGTTTDGVGRAGDLTVAQDGRSPLPPFTPIGWFGLAVVGGFVLMAAAAPWLSGYRVAQLAGEPLRAPSLAHVLGTNLVGQDIASQIVYGARVSLFMAIFAGGGTVVLGAMIGMFAGWSGGRTDAVLMRLVDLTLVIPILPLLIVVGAYADPSTTGIAVLIAAASWPPSARVVRAQVLTLRQRAHLQAAVGFGAGTFHVLRHHVVPEVGLIVVAAFISAASWAVMLEAGLAFLGLGDPTRSSWGRMMRDALDFGALFTTSAWALWLVPPVMAVTLLLLGLALVGIGMEQRLNPRLARHAGPQRGRP